MCRFSGDLALVLLTGPLPREMRLHVAGSTTASSDCVADVARAWAAEASTRAPVVHVDAFEFGDAGHDEYTLWADGQPPWTTWTEAGVRQYFREQRLLDAGPPFEIGRYRGENAAEKWAASALAR